MTTDEELFGREFRLKGAGGYATKENDETETCDQDADFVVSRSGCSSGAGGVSAATTAAGRGALAAAGCAVWHAERAGATAGEPAAAHPRQTARALSKRWPML